jgi:hypothetical protein
MAGTKTPADFTVAGRTLHRPAGKDFRLLRGINISQPVDLQRIFGPYKARK